MDFLPIVGVDGAVVAQATYVNVLSPPEIFDDYVLNFADAGRCEVFVRGTTVRLARGDLQWRLPGDLRIVRRADSPVIKRRSVLLRRETLENMLLEMGHTSSALLVGRVRPFRDPRVVKSLEALFTTVTSGSSGLAQESACHDIVSVLCETIGSDGRARLPVWPDHRGVRIIKEYIDECYAEDASLDALAALAGLNKFHLLRAFKRAIGIPPHRYRTHVRIARARRLLAAGVPIARLALEVGFGTQARFHEAFRAVVGVTPGRYRRAISDPRESRKCSRSGRPPIGDLYQLRVFD
jgi:AraC-like DNA-binding protein